MPRNSKTNSLRRFNEIKLIASNQKSTEINYCVEQTFELITEPYKTILNKSFFKTTNFYWWVDIYSKTTFYRLRSKAIDTFLFIYKNYEAQI